MNSAVVGNFSIDFIVLGLLHMKFLWLAKTVLLVTIWVESSIKCCIKWLITPFLELWFYWAKCLCEKRVIREKVSEVLALLVVLLPIIVIHQSTGLLGFTLVFAGFWREGIQVIIEDSLRHIVSVLTARLVKVKFLYENTMEFFLFAEERLIMKWFLRKSLNWLIIQF